MRDRLGKFVRSKKIDEGAFSTITPESAYWVGFLMGDGAVRKRHDSQGEIQLFLAKKDIGHIVKLRDFLRSDYKIGCREKAPGHLGGAQAYMVFRSDRIFNDLVSYGVVPHKTMRERAIGLEFNRDFWRGLVDADGYIGVYGSIVKMGLCGSREIISQFLSFVRTITRTKAQPYRHHDSPNLWKTDIDKTRAKLVIDALYRDATVALDRKQRIAEAVIHATRTGNQEGAQAKEERAGARV